ncbi:MAG: sulfotransferase, partial [Flavobacteriales bacterium]|nr:sulfotransferase [Flavobacteriales bacterium]
MTNFKTFRLPEVIDIESIKQNQVVFLTGSSRSGTTLLSNLLGVHSKVISCPENGFILTHFSKFKSKIGFNKQQVNSFVNHLWIRKRLMKSVWNLDSNQLTTQLTEHREKLTFELACKLVYQNYAPEKAVEIYIDKNPSHINFLHPLNGAFNQPKFIVIVRDYRDRYVSLVKLKKKSKLKMLRLRGNSWKRHQKNAIAFQKRFP